MPHRKVREQATVSSGRPARRAGLVATTPIAEIRSTDAQNRFGEMVSRAADEDIAITRHNVVRAVLVSASRYRALVGQDAVDLDQLGSRFELLYADMQKPEVRAATERALQASPDDLGRTAVAVARRVRRKAPR